MSDTLISQLPVATAVSSTDKVVVNQTIGGVIQTKTITIANLLQTLGIGGNYSLTNLGITSTGLTPITLASSMLQVTGNKNNYMSIDVQNQSTGVQASSDYVATANTGTDTTLFIDMGINNSAYVQASWTINGALDGYLYTSDGALSVGTASAKELNFFTGGTLLANKRLSISSTGVVTVNPQVATPAGGATTGPALLFGNTAGFGVYVGSGTPTLSAGQGSLYLRSDGSSTSTRLYVNTNGTTGWTNVVTAA